MVVLPELASFVHEPPIIEIAEKIAVVRHRGGGERAMSIRNLTRAGERIQRALRLHAAGEEHVIVDCD